MFRRLGGLSKLSIYNQKLFYVHNPLGFRWVLAITWGTTSDTVAFSRLFSPQELVLLSRLPCRTIWLHNTDKYLFIGSAILATGRCHYLLRMVTLPYRFRLKRLFLIYFKRKLWYPTNTLHYFLVLFLLHSVYSSYIFPTWNRTIHCNQSKECLNIASTRLASGTNECDGTRPDIGNTKLLC